MAYKSPQKRGLRYGHHASLRVCSHAPPSWLVQTGIRRDIASSPFASCLFEHNECSFPMIIICLGTTVVDHCSGICLLSFFLSFCKFYVEVPSATGQVNTGKMGQIVGGTNVGTAMIICLEVLPLLLLLVSVRGDAVPGESGCETINEAVGSGWRPGCRSTRQHCTNIPTYTLNIKLGLCAGQPWYAGCPHCWNGGNWGCWNISLLEHSNVGMAQAWNIQFAECSNAGMSHPQLHNIPSLEYPKLGIFQAWNIQLTDM